MNLLQYFGNSSFHYQTLTLKIQKDIKLRPNGEPIDTPLTWSYIITTLLTTLNTNIVHIFIDSLCIYTKIYPILILILFYFYLNFISFCIVRVIA
jgi:hypothetical protein